MVVGLDSFVPRILDDRSDVLQVCLTSYWTTLAVHQCLREPFKASRLKCDAHHPMPLGECSGWSGVRRFDGEVLQCFPATSTVFRGYDS
eukprot:s1344_g12.t1